MAGKRILFAGEIGRGTRQLDRIVPTAAGLAARGHQIALALPAGDRATPNRPDWLSIEAPAWRTPAPPGFLASSYADILLQSGYATPDALRGMLNAWLSVLTQMRPDLVVADFAPTAMLAARGLGIQVALLGDGFTIPPHTTVLPSIRPWADVPADRVQESEARLLAIINATMLVLGYPTLAALADLFAVAAEFLCTCPELDHYGGREAAYFGEVFSPEPGRPPDWPSGSAERFYVRIDARHPPFRPLIEALEALGLPSVVEATHLAADRAAALSRPNVRVTTEHLDRDAALANCDFVACQAIGMAAPALLASRPVLLLPNAVEHMMTLHRIAGQGLGFGVPADADTDAINAALRRLLDDSPTRLRVANFARSYQGYTPSLAIDAIVEECDGLLLSNT